MLRRSSLVLASLCLLVGACAPAATGDATIRVQLTNNTVELSQDTVASGRIVFDTTNTASDLVHEIEDIVPGARAELVVDLIPGTYLVVCNLPGHYQLGMWAYLEVTVGS